MPPPETIEEHVNMINQNVAENYGKKYANYKLDYFVGKYIKNTDLTDTLKTNLDRLHRDDTIYTLLSEHYKIKWNI